MTIETIEKLKAAGLTFKESSQRWEDSFREVCFETYFYQSDPSYTVYIGNKRFFFHDEEKAVAFAVTAAENIE